MADPGVSGEELRTYLDISGPYMSELTTAGVLHWMKNKNGGILRGRFDLKENVVPTSAGFGSAPGKNLPVPRSMTGYAASGWPHKHELSNFEI